MLTRGGVLEDVLGLYLEAYKSSKISCCSKVIAKRLVGSNISWLDEKENNQTVAIVDTWLDYNL